MKGEGAKKGYGSFFDLIEGKPKHKCKVRGCSNDRGGGRVVCFKHHMICWRTRNPLHAAYSTLRDHAKRRRLAFTLTMEQFAALVVPAGYLTRKGNNQDDLHIDRINPLKGYEHGNLQILTCSENSSKGATHDKTAWQAHYENEHPDHGPDPDESFFLKALGFEYDEPF